MLRIKELRKQQNITQQQLSNYLGITQATLSGWENEKFEIDNNSLMKCADYFNVSLDYLLGRTEEKNTDEKDDITFDDFTFAMYDEAQHLTEEDKQALLQMARLLKSKTEKRSNFIWTGLQSFIKK